MIKEKVFQEVKKIPKGKTKTYKETAEQTGKSARAVARILSKNPNPIQIPCHRVIRTNGKLGGYTYKGTRRDKMKKYSRLILSKRY